MTLSKIIENLLHTGHFHASCSRLLPFLTYFLPISLECPPPRNCLSNIVDHPPRVVAMGASVPLQSSNPALIPWGTNTASLSLAAARSQPFQQQLSPPPEGTSPQAAEEHVTKSRALKHLGPCFRCSTTRGFTSRAINHQGFISRVLEHVVVYTNAPFNTWHCIMCS